MAEHLLCKERVRSSSLLVSTTPGVLSGGIESARGSTNTELNSSGPTPRRPRVPLRCRATVRGLVLEPSSHVRTRHIEPLIRALHRRSPTSGSLGLSPVRRRRVALRGRTLPTGIRVSAVNRDLRFRRVLSRIIPTPLRLTTWSAAVGGQATKGTRWMPWRQEPMKDVAGCEKLRGVASRR